MDDREWELGQEENDEDEVDEGRVGGKQKNEGGGEGRAGDKDEEKKGRGREGRGEMRIRGSWWGAEE